MRSGPWAHVILKERTSVAGPKISRVFFGQLPKGLESALRPTLLPPAHTPTSRAPVIKNHRRVAASIVRETTRVCVRAK